MNERDWAKRFNEDLDNLLNGSIPPDSSDAPEEYVQALDVARRLASADSTSRSRHQAVLGRQLSHLVNGQLARGSKWEPLRMRFLGMARSLAGVAVLILLAVTLSWTIANLLPDQNTLPADLLLQDSITPAESVSPPPKQQAISNPTRTPFEETLGEPSPMPPTAESNPASTLPGSQAEQEEAVPEPTVETSTIPLTRYSPSEEIREHLERSWRLWDTLWVDAVFNSTYSGKIISRRDQAWIDQPDKAWWISGYANGAPDTGRLRTKEHTFLFNLESRTRRELDDSRLVPSTLYKMLFPSWSIALRPGDFQAIGQETVAGRKAVIVEYTNNEGQIADHFWIDASTGLILRWVHLPVNQSGDSSNETVPEFEITAIVYDVWFPNGIFDLQRPLPREYSSSYLGD